jgi:hypothetical protein
LSGDAGPIADPTIANEFTYLNLPTSGGSVVGVGTAFETPTCTGLLGQGCSLGYNDMGRNQFRGPGNWNFNFAVAKEIPVTEQVKVEFRGELYNAFNHHNYFVLTNNADVSGGITSVNVKKGGYGDNRDERRNVQFGLRLLF